MLCSVQEDIPTLAKDWSVQAYIYKVDLTFLACGDNNVEPPVVESNFLATDGADCV